MTPTQSRSCGERDYTVSLIRFTAMSFIITCHYMQYYDFVLAGWFNVGVQMFFCISGFLYGNKDIAAPAKFLIKNFKKILVPYYCFVLPLMVLYKLFYPQYLSVGVIIKVLSCMGTMEGAENLWFIKYILLCYCITPLLQWAFKKMEGLNIYQSFAAVAVICGGGGQLLGFAVNSYISFARIFCYIMGYYLAFALRYYGKKGLRGLFGFFAALCGVMNLIKIYVIYFSSKDAFFGFGYFADYAHATLGISIFLAMYIFVGNLKKNTFLVLSDKYSYSIFIVHQIFILGPVTLMNITDFTLFNWLVVLAAVIFTAVILKFAADKAARFLPL